MKIHHKFSEGDIVRHRKGRRYQITGSPDFLRIEATNEPAYAYAELPRGLVWVRSKTEMEDGRFTLDADEYRLGA